MSNHQIGKTPKDLWADISECWYRLPNKAFFFALLAAWLAVFFFLGNSTFGYIKSASLFEWMRNAYYSQAQGATNDDAFGELIPLIVLGLFWWKRRQLLALPLKIWWPGLLFLFAGAVMHITGYAVQQTRLSVVAMFAGIYGLMGLAWGRAWLKESFFPFWLFIFSVPLSALLLPVTFPLRLMAAWLTATVANLLTIPVVRIGTQLMSPDHDFQYDVAAACSGIRSLIAIFLLATIYSHVSFRSPVRRVLLMALAFPLSVLGNFARLMCIILAAEIGGQSVGNYVHENFFFSLIPYIPAILGLLWAGKWLQEKPAPAPSIAVESENAMNR